MDKTDKRIEKILKECEQADNSESGTPVKLPEELKDKLALKEKVQSIVEKIKKEERKQLNAVDEDCVKVRGRQGTHAGYNAQISVDEKHGLIVNSDVVNENNDAKQFSEQVTQANEMFGRKCKTACADAGYTNTGNLKETVEEDIEVIVPSQKQSLHKAQEDDPFGKDKFLYDKENNQYICPEGKVLNIRITVK